MKNKSNFFNKIHGFWIVIGLFLVIGCAILFYTYYQQKTPQVCNGNVCFTVEVADTRTEREKGLMNRESMAEDHGMVFVFLASDFHDFWMKNTLIPLDMIWIDDQMKVARILTAQPCEADPCVVYKSEVRTKYVLELNAGAAEKYGITEGTILQLKHIR